MATTATNNRVQDIGQEQKVPYQVSVAGTADVNQGDMVYLDTSAHLAKVVASDANAQFFLGVAADTSFRNLYGTKQYPDSGTIQVYVAGIFFMKTTASETYNEGTKVYAGADAQTVTTVAGTYALGTTKMRPGVTSVTGASGTNVDLLIVPQWPGKSAL